MFGEDAMGVTQIKEWFNRFKDGRTLAESDQRSGRPQTARSAAAVERVRNLVMADRRSTVREVAQEVGLRKDSARATQKTRHADGEKLATASRQRHRTLIPIVPTFLGQI